MTDYMPDTAHARPCRLSRATVRSCVPLLAAFVSVCAYPVLFLYFHNIREAVVAQVLPPVLLFLGVGLAAWLIFGLVAASMKRGACAGLVFLLLFMYYAPIDDAVRRLVPDWRWWRIAPALLFACINLALALRVLARRPQGEAACAKVAAIVGAVFLVLTCFNAASGLYVLASAPQAAARAAAAPAPKAAEPLAAGARPNFYFFIFDEYARQDVLKKYTGFDNAPFLAGLARRKFNISTASLSTAPLSSISTANSLSYSIQYKSADETIEGMNQPALFELFKKAGYRIYGYSPEFSFDEDAVDRTLQSTAVLTALSIEKTVLARSFFAYLEENSNETIRADRLSLLKQAAAVIEEPSAKPKFLYFHFLCPHEPFVFDENGEPVLYKNMYNWRDLEYYIGQLQFLSGKINELVDAIVRKDPHAVVLLQSDHGVRYFPGMQEQEKLACLNALYAGGQAVNIEGVSAINTLRLAVNHALGLDLEPLEDEPWARQPENA